MIPRTAVVTAVARPGVTTATAPYAQADDRSRAPGLHQARPGLGGPRALRPAGLRRHQPRRDRGRRPRSPRARSTTTSRGKQELFEAVLVGGRGRRPRADPRRHRRRHATRGRGRSPGCGSSSPIDPQRGVPAHRDPGGPGGAGLRALPRAGGAQHLRAGAGHRARPAGALRPARVAAARRSPGCSSGRCRPPGPRSSLAPTTRSRPADDAEGAIVLVLAGIRSLVERLTSDGRSPAPGRRRRRAQDRRYA